MSWKSFFSGLLKALGPALLSWGTAKLDGKEPKAPSSSQEVA